LILRAAEKMKKKEVIIAAAATPVDSQEDLLIQIRDLLKNKSTATLYVPLNHS
jgi:large conductance mechanosensitive channel